MTRRKLFAPVASNIRTVIRAVFLLILAASITIIVCTFVGRAAYVAAQGVPGPKGEGEVPTAQKTRKALNGQCPICGEMAEHYGFARGLDRCVGVPNSDGTTSSYVSCTPTYYDPGPKLARCRRCSAAFWQDAERKP